MNPPEVAYIAITMRDGSLTIMQFVTRQQPYEDDPGWTREPSKANVDAEIAKSGLDAKSWRIVGFEELPTDRTYRNAWRDDGKQLGHDIEHVRTLHTEKLRQERVALLEELDRQWMRATGQGKADEAKAVEQRRQRLRDLPHEKIASAKTVEAMKAIGLP